MKSRIIFLIALVSLSASAQFLSREAQYHGFQSVERLFIFEGGTGVKEEKAKENCMKWILEETVKLEKIHLKPIHQSCELAVLANGSNFFRGYIVLTHEQSFRKPERTEKQKYLASSKSN